MSKAIVLVSFLAAFAAGIVVGIKWQAWSSPASTPTTTHPSGPGGWLARELNLSPEQQEQMHKIWSEAPRGGRERAEHRRQLVEERDKAIAALVKSGSEENKKQYEAIQKRFSEQMAGLDRERQETWQRGVDRTKGILDAQQREKYEKILKDLSRGPGGGERGTRGGREHWGRTREYGRPGGERATSQPESASQN